MAVTDLEVKPRINAAEMERRRTAVRYAAAHNRIEGQFLDPEGAAIFEAYVRGEIEQSEIRPRLNALHLRP
jgi:hypothetical protein